MCRPRAHVRGYLCRSVTLVDSTVETFSRMSERPRPVPIKSIIYLCSQSKRGLKGLISLCRHLTGQHLPSPLVQRSEFLGECGEGDSTGDLGDTVASDGGDRNDCKERIEPKVIFRQRRRCRSAGDKATNDCRHRSDYNKCAASEATPSGSGDGNSASLVQRPGMNYQRTIRN